MTRSIACARPLALAGMLAAGLLAVPAHAQPVPSGKLTVTPDFPADDDDPTNLSGAACFVKDNSASPAPSSRTRDDTRASSRSPARR